MSFKPTPEIEAKIADFIYGGNKAAAVVECRGASGMNLKSSLEFVNKLEEVLRVSSPEKFLEYSRLTNDKFLNFDIKENIYLHIEGQRIDLHNQFQLHGYTYKSHERVFELACRGQVHRSPHDAGNNATTELRFTFHNVRFLRIQDEPLYDPNLCFSEMKCVGVMEPKPELALQMEQELVERNAVGPQADAKYEEADANIDWNEYLYVSFHVVQILISAETVKASIQEVYAAER